MDANEHVLGGALSKLLAQEGIHLQEQSHRFWGNERPNTYVDGSDPIGGMWCTPDIEITNMKILPFSESPGDHRTFIFDTSTRSILGEHLPAIVRETTRRLL